MTEQNQTSVPETDEYRKELLDRCALLGITVHPAAKNETIATKIAAHLAAKPEDGEKPADGPEAKTEEIVEVKDKEIHPMKRLHRVRITCNDPQKADQSGDIISVSNGVVGNIRFYFHFNKPWHVPEIVLNTIKEAKLFLHSSRKDGKEIITREVPRYNIEYLDPLDKKQLERIAAKQAAALASED